MPGAYIRVIQLDKACRTLMKHIVAVIAILAPLGGELLVEQGISSLVQIIPVFSLVSGGVKIHIYLLVNSCFRNPFKA